MATAAKEADVKKDEVKTTPKKSVMLLYSIYPSYTLVMRQEEGSYEPGPNGRRVRVILQEGVTCQFGNHRAHENAEFVEQILSNDDPRKTKRQFWYGFEWITAKDLGKLHETDTKKFDNFIARMFSMQERHGRQGKNTISTLTREIEAELRGEGYIK